MKKSLISVLVGAVILVVVLSVAKNVIAKGAVEGGVGLITGLKLKMQSLNVGIINTQIGIKKLRLYNPRGFEDKTMVSMPEIFVDYDLPSVFKGKVHLEEVRIHLEEFLVVKNKDGELNLDSLTALQAQGGAKPQKGDKEKPAGKAPEIQIDKLSLLVDKVIFKDYSKGGEPSVKEFNINLNEQHENITNPYTVVSIIVLKVMMKTPLAALTNFDVSGLKGSVADAMESSKQLASEAAAKASATLEEGKQEAQELFRQTPKKLESVKDSLSESTKEVTSGLKDTAASLKEKMKLPFGKGK